jgi:transcriptional antiterminator/mannitol/fructose-specific phosphotransferase system IIA component (Ntr-type)
MQLDHLAVNIIKKVASEPGLSLKTVCERVGLPQRNFYYRRSKIDDWLIHEGFSPLVCHPHQGVRLEEHEIDAILQKLETLDGQHYKLSNDERRDNLLLHLTCDPNPLFTQQLSAINHVSRNTTLEDLSQLKAALGHEHGLQLVVGKKSGYRVEGDRLALSLCILNKLQRALKYGDKQVEARITHVLLDYLAVRDVSADVIRKTIDDALLLAEAQLQRAFTDKDRRLLVFMLMFSLLDNLQGHWLTFSPAQRLFLRNQAECETAAMVSSHLSSTPGMPALTDNTLFITLLLCISKNLHHQPGNSPENKRLFSVIEQMVDAFQSLSGIYLSDAPTLIARLFSHLLPAIRRCLFHIRSENVLRSEVMQRYPLIFRLCRQAIVGLEQAYHITFNDDELSYVVISFAAWMDRRPETREQTLVLVTEGGMSSTAILENQIRHLTVVPLQIAVMSRSKFDPTNMPENTELIVTTVPLGADSHGDIPLIQVQHLLTVNEKAQLRMLIENQTQAVKTHELVNALTAAAERYLPQLPTALEQEFHAIIHHYLHPQPLEKYPAGKKTLAEYLQQRMHYYGRKLSWRQAIRKAARPLVIQQVISQDYAARIIALIEKNGLRTYLSPDVLLLHAEPPPDAHAGALSLLKLKYPLCLEGTGVALSPRLIILLVPSYDLSHMAMLHALNEMVSNESRLQAILTASSTGELVDLLQSMPLTAEMPM